MVQWDIVEAFFQKQIMFLLRFGFDCLDLESELAGNGLELMAKDMRTQPTSQNSGPTSQNLAFGQFVFGFVCISLVLIPQTVFL